MPALTLAHIGPLEKSHDRKTFDCGNESLNRYLSEQARQDAEQRVAAPFVLTRTNKTKVLGFYTLSSAAIRVGELPADLVNRLPRDGQLPVILLGRLAVDRSISGQRAGEFLLADALRRGLQAARQIEATVVVVNAMDEKAAGFYRHFGFQPFQHKPLRLFLSMHHIVNLFAE